MTLLLKQLFNFIRILNSETGTQQIAWGLSFGLVLGFSPFLSLQTFLVLLICIFFRVQMGAAFLSGFFFSFLAASLDSWADALGRWILEKPEWRGIFVQLYNMPLVPLTRFNNSIVMGSGALGFIAAVPAFFVFTFLIKKYRKEVLMRFQESRFWRFVKATSFYKWYAKLEELYG